MSSRKPIAISSSCVQLRKILGYSHRVKNGIVFSDVNTLFYLSGQQGVFHDLKTHKQTFQPIIVNTVITALCLSANGNLIVCSKGPDRKVMVINLSTGESRALPKADKVISDEYVAVSLSPDEERLGAQGGYPDWAFAIWQWKKHQFERVFHPIRLEPGAKAYNFSFCPSDSNKIVVFGHKFLRIYKYKDEPRYQEKLRDEERANQSFHSLAWQNNPLHLLIGNSLGEILVIENNIVLRKVSVTESVKKALKLNDNCVKAIRCLLATRNGFKCSYGGDWVLCLDEKFEIQKILNVPQPSEESHIVQLITNSLENITVAATEDGQIFTDTNGSTLQIKPYEEEFSLLLDRQHIKSIVCSDTVMQISLQATCSSIAIIIRNIFSGIVYHRSELNSVPICVSLHPLGTIVLIGFGDEWRAYNILHDKLQEVNLRKEKKMSVDPM
nr:cilia- and flagella-associated protein 57-like [Parasteatoda tepidariorum]